MHHYLTIVQWLAVIANQPLERKGEESVYSRVYKSFLLAGLLVQEARQCTLRADIFAPNHRIADDGDIRRRKLLQPAFVEPVVLAQRVWDSVTRFGLETFRLLPHYWSRPQHQRRQA